MRQFQFEVRNANEMRRELARIKRTSENENYKKLSFQINTQLTDLEEISELTDIIEENFPMAMYYGCQTYGNVFQAHISDKKTVVLCTVFEYESTKAELSIVDPTDKRSKLKSFEDVWKYCNKNSWVKGVEIVSSYNAAENLGIDKPLLDLREDVQVFGGIAVNSEDLLETDTYVFSKFLGFSKDAAIVVFMGGEDFHLKSSFVRGWEGLGKSFTITDCEGTLIRKIDDQPPLEIYKKYLNIDSIDSLELKAFQFPLLVEVDGIECIRQPFKADEDESISVIVGVENGMKVRLSYGEKQTIINNSRNEVPSMTEFAPDVIRVYSCASRRRYLGDEKCGKELSYFEDVAPTIGFFTRGEILRVGNYLHLFNSTMVYVLAREGEKVEQEYYLGDYYFDDNYSSGMTQNLISYIATITDELEGKFLDAMSGMANVYKNLFIIDTTNETIYQLDNDESARNILAEKADYKDKFEHFLDSVVDENYRDMAEVVCNIDTLPSKFKKRNVVSCELVGKEVGWFRAQFVVINRDQDGVPDRFVYTTRVIDEEKKESEEQHRIIEKLADTYYTMHLFDLATDTCKEIDTVDFFYKFYRENIEKGGQEMLFGAMRAASVPEHLDMMLEFTDFSTLSKRMKKRKVLAIDFHGTISGWAKAQFIEYERDSEGNLSKVLFVTQIIDEEKQKEEELIKKSTIDELTGLYNRRAYEEELKEIDDGNISGFRMFSLDVNGLKEVNDDIGHTAGDELLRGAAEVMLQCLKPYGKVFRIGGDEFSAVIFATDDELKRIQKDLDNTMSSWSGDEVKHLSFSYGIVSSNEFPKYSAKALEEVADKRMYESKELFYRHGGVDRRSEKQIYEMICRSYVKILSVNLTDDTYRMIRTDASEMIPEKGYSDESISKWLYEFAVSGQVHEDDKDEYIKKTDINYLRKHFKKSNDSFNIHYRRKTEEGYINVLMEMVKTDKYSDKNMDIFLYVKEIGD